MDNKKSKIKSKIQEETKMNKPKILVPTDFSSDATNALSYAIMIAKKLNASLVLMHAHLAPKTPVDIGIETYYPEPLASVKQRIDHKFEALKKIDPDLGQVDYDIIVAYDQPRNAILHHSISLDCQLIIMGTHGVSGLDEVLIGSNTYAVIKDATVPVLMVPGNYHTHHLSNIAFASDYEKVKDDDKVFQILKQLTTAFDATLNIIHIDDDDLSLTNNEVRQVEKFEHVFQLINPTYHLLQKQNIESGIENFAEQNATDLIVLIPRKYNIIERIFRKKVTKKLAFHSKIPILMLR